VKESKRKAVIIASGDLSHRLSDDGPYPYSPKGKVFDDNLITLLQKGDTYGIFTLDRNVTEEAGECGLRSLYILLGALNSEFSGELLSYEGPFGVGYGVMKMKKLPTDTDVLSRLLKEEDRMRKSRLETEDEYVKLARKSIRYFLDYQKAMDLPDNLPERMLTEKAGVFVSLKKYGNLRGCIGTFLPGTSCIGAEILHNAIEAAFEDPRFDPLRADELDELNISVDILSAPVSASKEELDPKRFGVIVTSGYRRGLLLPDLEGVDTVEDQLDIACRKAGISHKSPYEIQKFTVERHHEGIEQEL
jgi:AmmeMemoRadiSam system protein A